MEGQHRPNAIDYVEFPAADTASLARTRQFFTQAFGWTYQEWGADYVDTQDSGVGSGINADRGHQSAQPLIVIYVTDLEDARARVVAAGARITRDTFTFPGGRRFHFADPAGRELGVWSDQPAPAA